MRETGRQREITFRAAGEGTGNARDLDRFDDFYLQLFVWSHARSELAGAYRFGPTDVILPRYGREGMYTNTLFRYREDFFERTGPALEMGRYFVRPEYQRSYAPLLLLLWKGIARYVARNPHYTTLFGPVSITSAYHPHSRQLMAAYLKAHHIATGPADMVEPRTPFRHKKVLPLQGRRMQVWPLDLDDLSAWIAEIEPDGKGLPVLLRQYLKLGGVLLCFNVDRSLADALDGLILVNLLKTEPSLLTRYMGANGYARFRNFHSHKNLSTPSSEHNIPPLHS